jgi:hypothetical protein
MRKIILTALALAPLFGGVALAAGGGGANSHSGDGMPTQLGPMAYTPAQIAQAERQYQQQVYGQMLQYQPNSVAQHGTPTTQAD